MLMYTISPPPRRFVVTGKDTTENLKLLFDESDGNELHDNVYLPSVEFESSFSYVLPRMPRFAQCIGTRNSTRIFRIRQLESHPE